MSEGLIPPEIALPLGQVMVLPGPHELQIDIDHVKDLAWMRQQIEEVFKDRIVVLSERLVPSKTPGHFHVYLDLVRPSLTPIMRIALQACLGSDRKRELLSALAVLLEYPYPPTCFFEPEEAK